TGRIAAPAATAGGPHHSWRRPFLQRRPARTGNLHGKLDRFTFVSYPCHERKILELNEEAPVPSREETRPLYLSPLTHPPRGARPASSVHDPTSPDPIGMSTDESDVPESTLLGATPSIFRHPALDGFRLLRCEESNFFSEIWRAQSPSGEEKILY